MNTRRHAAVLTLMIWWYLFIPPVGGNEHSPVNQWQMVNTFDSEPECQAGREKYYKDGIELMKIGKTGFAMEEGRRFTSAACFAADDPRLRRN